MEVSELRIGNLIQLNPEKNWISAPEDLTKVVKSISEDGINYTNFPGAGVYWTALNDHFVGIPLTEEWLLKFGFEPNGVYMSMKMMFQSPGKATKTFIVATFDGEAWMELHSEQSHFVNGRETTRHKEMQSCIFRCSCVHQLQNIYFSLTGGELTINAL